MGIGAGTTGQRGGLRFFPPFGNGGLFFVILIQKQHSVVEYLSIDSMS